MTTTGKYEIIEEIGRGGFAVVYKARDPTLDRIVALKVLHAHVAENQRFLRRFEQEARTAARFDHPNIVTIYEVGEAAGQHYIAMSYLPGRGLDKVLEEADGPLPLAQVVDIVAQVAAALEYIHQRGAIHRDVKPANVIVSDAGRATLLDFGIVRAADETKLTTAGEMMGTSQYMSPEQAEGEAVDHRSDIYALGVMAYQMCAGQAPFENTSPVVVLRLHADKAPPDPREVNPDLPDAVARVILKALAKRPEDRYPSAGGFARALKGAVAVANQARREEASEISLLRSIPGWLWPMSGIVVGVLLLFFTLFLAPPVLRPPMTLTPTDSPTNTLTPTPTPTLVPSPSPSPTWLPDVPPPDAALHDTWTRPADEMVMVYVPGGTFQMGSTEGDDDEQPVHEVTLDGFWIDKYEVTNAQFVAFLNEKGNQEENGEEWLELEDVDCNIELTGGEFRPKNGYADHPVIEVSWCGARAYAEWVGGRLPTEAEWEKAARGIDGQTYPWGNASLNTELCNFSQVGDTTPVGTYSPQGDSPYGCADMAGNVWEWTSTLYEKYPYDPEDGRENPDVNESHRVLRGGSFDDGSSSVRCAARKDLAPNTWSDNYGFRVVMSSRFSTPAP